MSHVREPHGQVAAWAGSHAAARGHGQDDAWICAQGYGIGHAETRPAIAFFGPGGLGGGDSAYSQPGTYDATVQRLLQQFPGLASLTSSSPYTTGTFGFTSPGLDLYSGQAQSGGGLFGSTGTGIFEGASAGQPESITGGLSAGFLGKSPTQVPLSNTGQPGTSLNAPTPGPTGASAPFQNLTTPNGLATTFNQGPVSDENLLGAPGQSYDLLGPVKSVIGSAGVAKAFSPTAPMSSSFEAPTPTFTPGNWSNLTAGQDMNQVLNTGTYFGPGEGGQGPQGFGPGGTATAPYPIGGVNGGWGEDMLGLNGPIAPNLPGGGFGSTIGQIGAGIGGVLGGLQAYQGIRGGDPLAALQGLYSLYSGGNSALGLGLPSGSELLTNLGTSLGMEAANTGGQTAAQAANSAAGGWIMGGISAIPDVWELGNDYAQMLSHIAAQRAETEGIQKDFGTAWPAYQDTGNTVASIFRTQDPQELLRLYQSANYQLDQAPAVSHYISTRGGEQNGPFYSPAQDLSQIEPNSPQYSMNAVLANITAADKLAKLGVDTSGLNISDVFANPQALIGGLWGAGYGENGWNPQQIAGQMGLNPRSVSRWQYGGTPNYIPNEAGTYTETPTPWKLTPEQITAMQTPGNRLDTIRSIFSGINPNFDKSPLGATLAYLQQGQG